MKWRALLILLWLTLAVRAQAIEFRETDTYTLQENQILSNELWVQARTITLAGTAREDCFTLADSMGAHPTTNLPTLRLSGVFQSDLWGFGETVELSGTVSNNARLAASKTLMLTCPVGRNLMAFAPTISLGETSRVQGSALLAGQDVILSGTIHGRTTVYANKVTLTGTFESDLHVTADDITVMPGTVIKGDFFYLMDGDLVLDSGVQLGGKMIKQDSPVPTPVNPASTLMLQLTLLCGAIMVGMAFVSLMPGIAALSVHKLTESAWRCLLFGFITFALAPLIAIFLIFTVAGIPLSIILALAYLILIYVSKIIVGLFVGHLIIRKRTPVAPNLLFPVMSLGLLALYAATNLPFPFDITFWFAITLCGMGALVSAILDRRTPVLVSCSMEGSTQPPPLPGAKPPEPR
jgi:cytoskeletal protein CcmA (bactofilin family)